jgi:hypothetical protein
MTDDPTPFLDNGPGPGSDDCYNRVTDTCNAMLPGKDWGDVEYRNCIMSGLDWCDTNEPNRVVVVPGFDARGRLTKQNRVEKLWTQLFRS